MALQQLLGCLDQICGTIGERHENQLFLRNLLNNKELAALCQAHSIIEDFDDWKYPPADNNAFQMLYEVCEEMQGFVNMPEVMELCCLLTRAHMRAVFDIHDQIANKDYMPELPPEFPGDITPLCSDEEEAGVKIVKLVKSVEPLGATIKYDPKTGMIVIARVMHGGAADRSGLIHVGDKVQEVNGIPVKGRDPEEVTHFLASLDGSITFKLIPADIDTKKIPHSQIKMRAHFDYDPYKDELNPCPDASLSFRKGDILQIVDQGDPHWWQAKKLGEKGLRAGLIPGRQLQERRLSNRRSIINGSLGSNSSLDLSFKKSSVRINVRSSFRTNKRKVKKVMYHAKQNEDYDNEEVLTYEEVVLYKPPPSRPRPIVIIGPPGVGRNELKRRLIACDPDTFSSAIPHTSRPKRIMEEDGMEYYFVSREVMDKAVESNRLIEYGEYKDHMYGTSILATKRVIDEGQICLLCVHPQALRILKQSELKPYVIYIKPPSIDVLRATRLSRKAMVTMEKSHTRPFADEDLVNMVQVGKRMEAMYQHYFDCTITNDNLQRTFMELKSVISRVQTQEQWVSSKWLR
ncbi:MAGUK p55 subfamily member 7 isoform X3 [Strongylocentrotus purpuratus]|uniref:MAGUK p55 subfamily member 7 n=1 Tax=Strongylocentrotus purpuratus TaxID=7668 RepID=A0A7M7STP7_STRPU|nr:MAGUK p55 subfamily member 7 isoform X3 [Strongylocentrotus purpuratus]